jgi:triphosphatase
LSEAPAAASNTRVHLDLALHPDDAAAVWRAPALAQLRGGARLRSTKLSLTWHDGAARELSASGLVLARQQKGTRAAWRLERMRPERGEDWLPAAAAPVVAEASAPEGLGTAIPRKLVALASFEGMARSFALPHDAALEAVGLQAGTLRANDGERRACRLLLAGPATTAFELACSLAQTVRLEVPRAGLAAMAAYPEGAPARHLGAANLPPGASLSAALALLIGQLTDVILYWAPLASVDGGPEPVHQMRVALRRLRSALQVFGRMASCPALETAGAALRALAQTLGAVRDWDVFVHDTVPELAASFADDRTVLRLLAAAERRRRDRYATLQAALDDPAFRRLGLELAELACVRPWETALASAPAATEAPPDLQSFGRQALARRMRRVVAMAGDFAERAGPDLHALRLQCKRLRYAAELFSPLFPGRGAGKFMRRLAALQERLGRLNDASVAADLMHQLGRGPGRAFASGVICGWVAAAAKDGRGKAERSWRRFRACDPFWD